MLPYVITSQTQYENYRKKVDILFKNSEQQKSDPVEHHTDEEDLPRETEWIVQGNRRNKKRKANSSLEGSPDQSTPTVVAPTKMPKTKKILPPPPINLVGVNKYEDIIKIMQYTTIESY